MLKQLDIADIEPLISKLEQGYSNGSHTINALAKRHASLRYDIA